MNTIGDYCHPYLKSSLKCNPLTETSNKGCLQDSVPCKSCCLCYERSLTGQQILASGDQQYQPCCYDSYVPKECNNNCYISHDCQPCKSYRECHQSNAIKDQTALKVHSHKNTSCTEPMTCVCDPFESKNPINCCGGEKRTETRNGRRKDLKKNVRFADEVTYIDCDKAFENLEEEDVKELCQCCKELAIKEKCACVCKPVLVYELPEPKMEESSVTKRDFHWHKTPEVEVPPWHPNIKDRWHPLDIPSLKETTYQCDFKPPTVIRTERCHPVYLTHEKEERDPCQQLAEEYPTWKKTSIGPGNVCRVSNCHCEIVCDREKSHACEVAKYKCPGDVPVCNHFDQCGPKFTLCEFEGDEESRYWWQRTCCLPKKVDITKLEELPADIKKPACPSYTTSYGHDFKHPKQIEQERDIAANCSACDYCARPPNVDVPLPLCTKQPNEPFMRGVVIES